MHSTQRKKINSLWTFHIKIVSFFFFARELATTREWQNLKIISRRWNCRFERLKMVWQEFVKLNCVESEIVGCRSSTTFFGRRKLRKESRQRWLGDKVKCDYRRNWCRCSWKTFDSFWIFGRRKEMIRQRKWTIKIKLQTKQCSLLTTFYRILFSSLRLSSIGKLFASMKSWICCRFTHDRRHRNQWSKHIFFDFCWNLFSVDGNSVSLKSNVVFDFSRHDEFFVELSRKLCSQSVSVSCNENYVNVCDCAVEWSVKNDIRTKKPNIKLFKIDLSVSNMRKNLFFPFSWSVVVGWKMGAPMCSLSRKQSNDLILYWKANELHDVEQHTSERTWTKSSSN